jgi:H+/Cl- antiporter ClcA
MAPLVLGGTLVTHLVGGSAGREGTAIQMSGSLADAFGRAVRLGRDERRVLLVAAMAGGFGAVFGVPFAGWVFALEVSGAWRRDRRAAVVPALLASVVGDRVVHLLGVRHAPMPQLRDVHLGAGLVARLVLAGVAFGVGAMVFHGATRLVRRASERALPWPPARPMVGGLVLVALVLATGSRQNLGLSLPLLAGALAGGIGVASSAFVGKLVFTAVTLGSGFPGGEVTPLFVFGGTLGVTVARLLDAPVALLASVGMVAVFGAAANAPVACTVMAVELFGWSAVVPAAIACVVARLASTRHSIYGTRGTSAAMRGRKGA